MLLLLRKDNLVPFDPFLPLEPEADSYLIPDRGVRTAEQELPLPPPHLLLGHNEEQFLEWGAQHANQMRCILEECGQPIDKTHRVLDFGCGSGRLLRQFHSLALDSEFWGVDIRAAHVQWCKQNISPPFHLAVTTIFPHLPFEDGYFDLIYAGSVFTHIDDLADAWFMELRRILRPGGTLYFTVHDNHSIKLLRTTLRDQETGRNMFAREKFKQYISSNYLMFTLGRSHDSQVFYDIDYLKRQLGGIFEVLAVHPQAYGHQTGIVVRKAGNWSESHDDKVRERLRDLRQEHQTVLDSRSYRVSRALATPYWKVLQGLRSLRRRLSPSA